MKKNLKPIFKNKPNEHLQIKYQNIDLDVWLSRSVAVVGIVMAITQNDTYILIAKRSKTMVVQPSLVCIPCGYLDWNESGHDAMVREVFEETSLYLPDIKKYSVFTNDKKPILINDSPITDKQQNVSLIYLSVFDFIENELKFPIEVEKFNCAETDWVKWISLTEFYDNNYEWAFNHDSVIKDTIRFFNKKMK